MEKINFAKKELLQMIKNLSNSKVTHERYLSYLEYTFSELLNFTAEKYIPSTENNVILKLKDKFPTFEIPSQNDIDLFRDNLKSFFLNYNQEEIFLEIEYFKGFSKEIHKVKNTISLINKKVSELNMELEKLDNFESSSLLSSDFFESCTKKVRNIQEYLNSLMHLMDNNFLQSTNNLVQIITRPVISL